MADLEILFLFSKPLTKWEQDAFDNWVKASPWRIPGQWTMWCLSYGDVPENFMQASGLVVVGADALHYVLEQERTVLYTRGGNPRPMKPDLKIKNRAYKPQRIAGFGSFKFILPLKSEGQLRMAQKFAKESGYPVKSAGFKNTVTSLWELYMHLHAVPVNQNKP